MYIVPRAFPLALIFLSASKPDPGVLQLQLSTRSEGCLQKATSFAEHDPTSISEPMQSPTPQVQTLKTGSLQQCSLLVAAKQLLTEHVRVSFSRFEVVIRSGGQFWQSFWSGLDLPSMV